MKECMAALFGKWISRKGMWELASCVILMWHCRSRAYWSESRTDEGPERIAAAIADGPETEGELVSGTGLEVHRLGSRNVAEIDGHVVLERVSRRPAGVLDRPLRERLKVERAGVAPPPRLIFLDRKKRACLFVALGVDERRQSLPSQLRALNRFNAAAVAERQLVPEESARRHLVVLSL